MATTETYVGATVLRKEDPELLTGQASYVDDQTMPGMVWVALVRPPYVQPATPERVWRAIRRAASGAG